MLGHPYLDRPGPAPTPPHFEVLTEVVGAGGVGGPVTASNPGGCLRGVD